MKNAKLSAMLLLVACMAVTSVAADVVSNNTNTFSQSFPNPCTGEWVDVTGIVTDSIKVSTDKRGGVHISVNVRVAGQAVGQTTGRQWSYASSENFSYNTTAGGTFTFNEVLNFTLSSLKGGKDLKGRIRYHGTVLPDGSAPSSIEDESFTCK